MDIIFRQATLDDEPFLWEMLFLALYAPKGQPPFTREILKEPDIACYAQGWGRDDDRGIIAMDGDKAVGAAWLRFWKAEPRGYGYVDDNIPEISIALLPDYRNKGTGARMIQFMLDTVKDEVPGVSLSVMAENPAARLYQRLGFEVVKPGESLTMLKRF
jgi:ribosomal protein S18 acetylase RimI-like enzyme